ncbi:MAG: UDP-3-O-(3-hydroxymyristoyl)glucosamine N-acyltransferase [Tepidisphaeraceae bacterium]
MRLDELAKAIGAELVGDDGATHVCSCATLEDAAPGQIGFLANAKYAPQLNDTKASAVIVAPGVKNDRVALLKTKDPYYAFAQAVVALHGQRKHPHAGVHPKAHVDPSATIGQGTIVYPGAFVGPGAKLGRDCILYPNAVVYDDCVLGDHVILQAGAVIGADGFGYATHKGEHHKIPQVGNVVLEDDVEVGANSAIDRAALGSTVIGRGTKIDNLVTIGHGARVGPFGMIVAQCGIAGSARLGHHVTIAGQVGVAGHLNIGNAVTIGAQSGVMFDLDDQTTVVGTPAMPAQKARRVYQIFTELPELKDRVKKLEEAVGELGSDEENA